MPMMTRESPMFAAIIVLPRIIARERVVPLNSVSTREFLRIAASHLAMAWRVAFLGSVSQSS